jgi:ABC-type transport system involved in cytochrome c biogenesis ATPase subunit
MEMDVLLQLFNAHQENSGMVLLAIQQELIVHLDLLGMGQLVCIMGN